MKAEPFEANAAIRRHNPWLLGLSASPAGIGIGLLLYTLITRVPAAIVSPHLFILGAALVFMNLRRKPRAVIEPVRVEASLTALRVGGRVVPRSEIQRALFVPAYSGRAAMVRVSRKWALPIDIVVQHEVEGRRLLAALGMDASQTVARFRALSRALAHKWKTVCALFIALPVLFGFLASALGVGLPKDFVPMALPFFVASIALITLVPTRVDVGPDGVLLRWFWTRRFIPSSTIATVRTYDEGFGRSRYVGAKITLASGEDVKVPVGSAKWADEEAATLVERIREAVDSYKRGDAETAAALLARGELPLAEWIRTLRGIGAGAAATLRTAAVDPERLWRVLESPSAEPKDRAAAAIALSASEEQGNRERIRIAADAIAQPKLRVAVQAAANEDEAALAEALSELDDPRGAAR